MPQGRPCPEPRNALTAKTAMSAGASRTAAQCRKRDLTRCALPDQSQGTGSPGAGLVPKGTLQVLGEQSSFARVATLGMNSGVMEKPCRVLVLRDLHTRPAGPGGACLSKLAGGATPVNGPLLSARADRVATGRTEGLNMHAHEETLWSRI